MITSVLDFLQMSSMLFVIAVMTASAMFFLATTVVLIFFQPAWLPRRQPPAGGQTPLDPFDPSNLEADEVARKKKEEERAATGTEEGKPDDAAASAGQAATLAQVSEMVAEKLIPVQAVLEEIRRKLPEKPPERPEGEQEPSREEVLLTEIRRRLDVLTERWTEDIKGLPELFISAFKRYWQEEEEARKERLRREAAQQDREAKARARQEAESRKLSMQADFSKRLDAVTSKSDLYAIATLVKQLTDELEGTSPGQYSVPEALPPYLGFVASAENVRSQLSKLNGRPGATPPDGLSDVEINLKALEEQFDNLSRSHKAIRFTSLLDEAGRNAAARDKAEQLKELLNLEEVSVEPGAEMENLDSLKVEGTVGTGKRLFIQEVLERGYRLKDSKTVIKQPKVIIRMEN